MKQQVWTITYEDEQEDGSYQEVHKIDVVVPDNAGILKDSSWTEWLIDIHNPE